MEATKSKKQKDIETLRICFLEHYGEDLTIDEVPTWSSDSVWINPKKCCKTDLETKCYCCNHFCFQSSLRGIPPRDVNWFLDDDKEAVIKLGKPNHRHIQEIIFQFLRPEEIRLRSISRKLVLCDIFDRFRGNKRDNDSIDEILSKYNFKSLDMWCKFKDNFDREVIQVIEKNKRDRLYCTGCGERSEIFTSRMQIDYAKCALGRCDFFHRVGSHYATVKKK